MRRRLVPILLLLAACGQPEPARVGVVVSHSPSAAGLLAVADHEGAGGTPFEVVLRESPTSTAAEVALQLAEELVADARVLAVVGHSNSSASLAASQVYNRAGVVQIAPTTTATVYRDAGSFSFRMVPGDDRQAAFVASVLDREWSDTRRVAAVHVNDDYGRSFYRELRPFLDTIVFEGVYAELADTTHLTLLVQQIVTARPDVLIWVGRPLRLRVVLQQLRAALPGLRTICGDACDDAAVYGNANGEYTGLRFVRFVDPLDAGEDFRMLQDRYRAATGAQTTAEAVLTYDAVRVIGQALDSGARTREAVREYLMSLGRDRAAYAGVSGAIAFDADGSVTRSYGLADVHAGGVAAVTVPPR